MRKKDHSTSGNNRTKRIARTLKRIRWGRVAALLLYLAGIVSLLCWAVGLAIGLIKNDEPEPLSVEPEKVIYEHVFKDDYGEYVDMQSLTKAWAAEAGFEKRYDLTDEERREIASVITAEAVGEPYAGKVAVAQCILQACEDDELRPGEVFSKYNYSRLRPDPCEEALDAVRDVFDFGHVATTEAIKYFYAPARVESEWHETQAYVMTINGHRFFAEVPSNE